MKRTLNIAGTSIFAAGLIFKFIHLPGASILIILGGIASVIGQFAKEPIKFESDLLDDNLNENSPIQNPTPPKWPHVLSKIGTAIVIIGAIFKIQHWPNATILLITGIIMAAIGKITLQQHK